MRRTRLASARAPGCPGRRVWIWRSAGRQPEERGTWTDDSAKVQPRSRKIPGRRLVFETVVVGADGSDTAAEAVRVATELVKLSNGNLHIVTAYRPAQLRSEAGGEFSDSLSSDDLAQSVLSDLASRART